MTLGADLDYLVDGVFIRFFHNKLAFCTPFHTILFGGKSLRTAYTVWGAYLLEGRIAI